MKRRLAALAAATLIPLSACGSSGADSGGLEIVTSIYPLQYVAERVAGDHATVTNLVNPGMEPHEFELGIEQTAKLSEAELVVYLSGLQPAMDDAVEQADTDHVIDAMESAMTMGDPDRTDPHVWLDPQNMTLIGREVETTLRELDPDHAGDYRRNFEALSGELESLSDAYRTGLSNCSVDTVVVSHDAFGYLPTPFRFHAIVGLSPQAEPSPQHLAELHELVEAEDVTTVFTEPLSSTQLADTLAEDLGVRTATLDPLEGLSDETAGEDYLSLMRRNLDALKEANGCR